MAHKLTWSDRLRIERVVWMLDQRLYDIPRESRIAHRREVRLNLLSAAQDIGTRDALRNIGTSVQLAAAYLAAEFGDRPRHSWIAAGLWAATSLLVVTAILADAARFGHSGCLKQSIVRSDVRVQARTGGRDHVDRHWLAGILGAQFVDVALNALHQLGVGLRKI